MKPFSNSAAVIFIFYYTLLYTKGNAEKFVPVSATMCGGNTKEQFLDYREVGPNGKKAWFANITFPFTVDANTEFTWELRWWKNEAWEKKAHTFKGRVCFYLQKFAEKVWRQIREATKPPIKSDCPVPKDTYLLENFETDYSSIRIPLLEKGRWQGKISVTKEGKALCVIVVADMV